MKTIEATYRIVTPMFIGGANQDPSDGIRPPSFKGALRFWWRTLHWGEFLQGAGNDEAAALKALHKKECELFGSAAKDKKGGQGIFLLRVVSNVDDRSSFKPSKWHQYLLGQGLYHFKQGLLRTCIEGGEVSVYLHFNPKAKIEEEIKKDIESIGSAMMLLGLLGGLGSRSRKGFGSLAIQNLKVLGEDCDVPQNVDGFKRYIQKVVDKLPSNLPPYSSFSTQTRIDVSQTSQDALALLSNVGKELQMYRSYGRADRQRKHKVNGLDAEQNFEGDHALMMDAVNGLCPEETPKRAVFGLPHNYFFSSIQPARDAKIDIAPENKNRTRRASPLLIHVHQFQDGSYAVVQSLLQSKFLAKDASVGFKARKLQRCSTSNVQVDWQVVHDYLNRFDSRVAILGGQS